MSPRPLSDTARYHLAQARAAVERAKGQHPDHANPTHPHHRGQGGRAMSNENAACPSCDRDLSYPGKPGHECYTYAERAKRIATTPAALRDEVGA